VAGFRVPVPYYLAPLSDTFQTDNLAHIPIDFDVDYNRAQDEEILATATDYAAWWNDLSNTEDILVNAAVIEKHLQFYVANVRLCSPVEA